MAAISEAERERLAVHMATPNHSIQRMRASRAGQWQFGHLRRLAPTADADR
jgi:hypothetical protein